MALARSWSGKRISGVCSELPAVVSRVPVAAENRIGDLLTARVIPRAYETS